MDGVLPQGARSMFPAGKVFVIRLYTGAADFHEKQRPLCTPASEPRLETRIPASTLKPNEPNSPHQVVNCTVRDILSEMSGHFIFGSRLQHLCVRISDLPTLSHCWLHREHQVSSTSLFMRSKEGAKVVSPDNIHVFPPGNTPHIQTLDSVKWYCTSLPTCNAVRLVVNVIVASPWGRYGETRVYFRLGRG